MDIKKDYYLVMGISPTAETEDVKKAYRQLVKQHHPDSQQQAAGTTLLFRQIQEAYEILSDPVMRAAYDRGRAESGLTPEAAIKWVFQASRQSFPVIPEEQTVYVLMEISAVQPLPGQARSPMNLCLVLDRSTSMQGQRLDQVKAATYRLIDSLTPQDSLGIITFSDRAEVVWPNQPAADTTRAKAKVAAIQASGGTEIYHGMAVGLQELEKHCSGPSVNHMLLLTDGQTYGDEDRCLTLAVEAKRRTMSISCLGLGDDWNDALLDAIANRSGGVSLYIASATDVQTLFQERLRGVSATYAEDLQLTLRCAKDCQVDAIYKLSPYISRVEQENGLWNLGTLQSTNSIPIIIEMVVGSMPVGQHRVAQFELAANITAANRSSERLKYELKLDFSQDPPTEPAPAVLLSGLAKVAIFRMQNNAWRAVEQGNIPEATRRLETMATRLLDLGEHQLARAALLEAGRLARSGYLSPAGRKTIKYGTRSLSLSPKERGND